MKNIYFILLLLTSASAAAQVGINTYTPHASATLEVSSANKAISFPVIGLVSKTDVATAPAPTESLIVYNSNPTILSKQGYYFWDGAKWDYFFSDLNQNNFLN